jgi:RNA polymerase sigma-70 factor (ECF subfamily)
LAARLKAGDDLAFQELVTAETDRLRRSAERIVQCRETAAEIVQEVFYRMWKGREELTLHGPLGHYLIRAVRNRALDHLKRLRVESRWQVQTEQEVTLWLDRSGEETSDLSETLAEVEAALETLPERRRAILLLRLREGLSYEEIARRLGISIKTVENQIGRGLKTLRTVLHVSSDS